MDRCLDDRLTWFRRRTAPFCSATTMALPETGQVVSIASNILAETRSSDLEQLRFKPSVVKDGEWQMMRTKFRIAMASVCGCAAGIAVAALGSRPVPVHPLKQGAINYYDGSCARCHGPFGSAYGKAFHSKYDLEYLRKRIDDMANGPGQNPLDDEGMKAQVAFHQAIITDSPFIDWTARDGQTLSGEVTRKATLSASLRKTPVAVVTTNGHWTITMPTNAHIQDLKLVARLNGRVTTWEPHLSPYSTPPKWPPAANL